MVTQLYQAICYCFGMHTNPVTLRCKKTIVKITNLLVSIVARNSGNCNLIGHVGCYGYTCNYNPIIVISFCLIDLQRRSIISLIESLYLILGDYNWYI